MSDRRTTTEKRSASRTHEEFAQKNARWDRRVKDALSDVDKAATKLKRIATTPDASQGISGRERDKFFVSPLRERRSAEEVRRIWAGRHRS